MGALTGRTALVTGASRGLGRAIARRLAADGATLIVHYAHDEASVADAVRDIEADGGTAHPLRADFAADGAVQDLTTAVEEHLDGRRLDILVNNAGAFAGLFGEVTPEEFDRLFAVNVKTPYFLVQHLLPLLADHGRIITLSSAVTRIATPEIAYAMTKGALDALTPALANLLGPRGITVNAVAPGVTATDMNAWLHEDDEATAGVAGVTALGRVGQPADIADAVAFLASDDARWVTGHILDATGGLYLGPTGFRPERPGSPPGHG